MMNNILTPPRTSSKQLWWDPEHRRYVGEISSTNGFGRVYADACDEGLTLVSPRTGQEIVFVVDGTMTSNGETIAWELKPVELMTNEFRVLLFND